MAMDSAITNSALDAAGQPSGRTHRGPFALMTILFFMWGFLTVWNDVLIPLFKDAFTLNYKQAMLIQFAFFGAYAVGSFVYYMISAMWGDPINRIGYKNGVVIGLLFVAAGCAVFYPAAIIISYPFFLTALFIVGLGFAILQIAANPYVTILGPERTASSRLNLSQAFNSFGYTIGSPLAGWLIFVVFNRAGQHGAESAKIPYLCFAGVFLMLALFFRFAPLPNFTNKEHITRGAGALKYPHMVLGIIAIFLYVGAEVTIGSSIVNYLGLPKIGGLAHAAATNFLPFYWGGAMIGRFMGAFALSDIRKWLRHLIIALLPISAFVTVWLFFGHANAYHYGILLAILMAAFFLGESSPHRMLVLFSFIIIAMLLMGVLSAGEAAKWAILGIGLFNSIMWSNIFSMAIEGLGEFKSQGSSLLVMAILGGALLPPLQGFVADWKGLQYSFIVPIASYIYIAFYGLYGYRAGRQINAAPTAI